MTHWLILPDAVRSMPLLDTLDGALCTAAVAQIELEILRAHDGIEAIRLDLIEAERIIEPLRRAHDRQSVESNELISAHSCRGDRRLGERQTKPESPGLRTNVEALQLSDRGRLEWPYSNAAKWSIAIECQEQRASGREVGPGQGGEFRLEALETQIETEPGSVLSKQPSDVVNLSFGGDRDDASH
jgi:hypothetical protein